MSDKLKNGVKSLTTIAKNKIQGKDQSVPEEVAEKRLRICKACPLLNKTLNQCKECGCFVNYKTKFRQESCPKKMWTQWEPKEEKENA